MKKYFDSEIRRKIWKRDKGVCQDCGIRLYEEFNITKIAVISGVGVRQYFRNLGYTLQDSYMVKYI